MKHKNYKIIYDIVKDGIRNHSEFIPKVKSLYLRVNTTRGYIQGRMSVGDLHSDYVDDFKNLQCKYVMHLVKKSIFLSIYQKDQFENCHIYMIPLKMMKSKEHNNHILEKNIVRVQKRLLIFGK